MNGIDKFLELSESLKLVRNTNVEINNEVVIDEIYTDLLPKNGILSKVNLPRTTILVGRKGTGKSTIFQKSQREIDKNKNYLSIYIDVKTLYDNSTPKLPTEIESLPESKELIKYLIYSNFVKDIVIKTKCKLKKRIEKNYIVNVLGLSEVLLEDVYGKLDNIEKEIDVVFKQLNTSLITRFKNSVSSKVENSDSANLEASTAKGIGVSVGSSEVIEKSIKTEFDNSLVNYLDLKKCFIDNIIKIRNILKIKTLFIYLDDFSEIDKYAQALFMDWFIAPVNNLSEDFVKFKIATYPKRFHYGKLDNAKIDKVSLDFFDAFYTVEKKTGTTDISTMERLALDYTERLLSNRFKVYFPDNSWEELFEITPKELYEQLFISTMNIPRKMGYILSYCHESCLIHDIKIGKSAIENAALRYYNDVIEEYFLVNEYVCKPFEDKVSNEHQYELLDHIVKKQISNKEYLIAKKGKITDTSHFFVSKDLDYLLDNLELNGFISTYNQKKDDANVISNVYCLDLGLCKKFNLIYGRPYVSETNGNSLNPLFNFNNSIMEYFYSTQVIKCEKGHESHYSELDNIKLFGMKCPVCLQENIITPCSVQPKFADIKQKFEEEESNVGKIQFQEYTVLDILKKFQKPVSYETLSVNIDVSLTSLPRIIKKMLSSGWLEMDLDLEKALGRKHVRITIKGVKVWEKINKFINGIKIEKL